MNQYAIQIEGLSKQYNMGRKKAGSLRESFSNIWGRAFNSKSADASAFWALKDISLEIEPGEIVGVIGRNGAGKSTLLKVLSRITPPTRGRITMDGRIASLLEVGTGFHLELTGRENIFLNGAILGMRRKEIQQKFDEIVAFSGIEPFLDTAVKHYSSGMFVRLAFAVAAHLEAEILLVDEVLAVGDLEFQKKSLGKMEEVARKGKTVLLVSHNLGLIEKIAEKAFLLEGGQLIRQGTPTQVVDYYSQRSSPSPLSIVFDGPLRNKVHLIALSINGKDPTEEAVIVSPLEVLEIGIKLQIQELSAFRVTLSLFKQGARLFTLHDSEAMSAPPGVILSNYRIPGHFLRPGFYQVAVGGLEKNKLGDWFWKEDVAMFHVKEEWDTQLESINHGLINLKDAICQRRSL